MDLEARLLVLDELYRIFEAFINTQPLACSRGCDSCCTCNVTLTTLEGLKLIRHLDAGGQTAWATGLRRSAPSPRFRPLLTINRMAALCAADEPLPEESNDAARGRCPLLCEGECPVYGARPFACRCMVSRRVCSRGGHAEMDSVVVTVSNVLMQTIEHLDASGCTGNLVDVLLALADGENRGRYQAGRIDCSRHGLLCNQQMGVLMVPPEHRRQVQPLLAAMRDIRLPVS